MSARGLSLSLIREVMQAAAPGAIDLALGEPRHAPPASALGALRLAADDADLGYTPNAGLPELRGAVALRRPLHGDDGTSVLITVGSQQALAVACLGLLEPGDEVALPALTYPSCAALAVLAGAVVRRAADDQVEDALSPRTRLVIVGSPANPTGAVLSPERLAALAGWAARNDAWILLDEIYGELQEQPFSSLPASASGLDRVLLLGGVSKSHALCGLRVGWLVAPPRLIEQLLPVHQHLVTCAPRPSQRAALAALREGDDTVTAARDPYRGRLRRMEEGLSRVAGVRWDPPRGAFFLWLDARQRLGAGTRAFALEQARAGSVLVVPGEAFGPAGTGFLRLSFSGPEAAIDEGVARLGVALERRAA